MTTPALLAAALLLGAAPEPSSLQLAVVPLGAAPQLTFTARRVAEGVAREVAADGVPVVGPEEAQRLLGRERAEQLSACRPTSPPPREGSCAASRRPPGSCGC